MENRNVREIPTQINAANIYADGVKLVGHTGAVELPKLKPLSSSVEGFGILGSFEDPSMGLFENFEVKMNFRTLEEEGVELIYSNKNITLRASVQGTSTEGGTSFTGLRVVMRGACTEYDPGKVEQGKSMDGSASFDLTYYKLERNEKVLLEVDKLNAKFVLNGVDMLKKVRSLI